MTNKKLPIYELIKDRCENSESITSFTLYLYDFNALRLLPSSKLSGIFDCTWGLSFESIQGTDFYYTFPHVSNASLPTVVDIMYILIAVLVDKRSYS